MSKSTSVAGLGNQGYDGFSDRLVGGVKNAVKSVGLKPTPGKVLDGFIKPSNIAGSRLKQTAQTVHRSAQRSKTLARSAVSKPNIIKHQQELGLTPKSPLKRRASLINPARSARAQAIQASALVRRFSPTRNPAKKNPVLEENSHLEGEVVSHRTTASSSAKATTIPKALPSMVTSVSHHQIERLLDQALFRADIHRRAQRGRIPGLNRLQRLMAKPKWVTAGTLILILGLLVGFFAWQNVPQVSMRLAASRAHVDASVPAYTPAGFSFAGPISYSSNSVKMNFKANSDSKRTFAITQQSSSENSASLTTNNLPAGSSVQTSQINGTTVYIYGDKNNATWVNHGVRYTVEDKASLNSDQILKIANGL